MPDAAHTLLPRLARVRDRAALLVEERSATDPTATDPLRGLYLSGDAVRHLLGSAVPDPSPTPGEAEAEPEAVDRAMREATTTAGGDRLARLADRHGLTELDVGLLLVALAPDVDRTFEPLYGYLNDDVSRRRATTGLALDLCGLPVHLAWARARFHPSAPLSALGLVEVGEPERPFLSRTLRVPDRLIAHLLGDDGPDAALAGHIRPLAAPSGPYDEEFSRKLAERLTAAPSPPTCANTARATGWPSPRRPCGQPVSTPCT